MNVIFSLARSIEAFLARMTSAILVALGCAVALLMFSAITTRLVGLSFYGAEELTLLAVMWLYMLGAIIASRERAHLSADFVHVMTQREQSIKLARALSSLLSLAIGCFILVWSWELVSWSFEKQQRTPVFRIPWIVSQASVFLAATVMLGYLLRDCWRDFFALWQSSQKGVTRS